VQNRYVGENKKTGQNSGKQLHVYYVVCNEFSGVLAVIRRRGAILFHSFDDIHNINICGCIAIWRGIISDNGKRKTIINKTGD
jgi:hypothetical protein